MLNYPVKSSSVLQKELTVDVNVNVHLTQLAEIQ